MTALRYSWSPRHCWYGDAQLFSYNSVSVGALEIPTRRFFLTGSWNEPGFNFKLCYRNRTQSCRTITGYYELNDRWKPHIRLSMILHSIAVRGLFYLNCHINPQLAAFAIPNTHIFIYRRSAVHYFYYILCIINILYLA